MVQLKKNDIYEAQISGITAEGQGVCRIDGLAVFVKGAIPGETWKVKIMKVTSSCAWARGMELITPSEERCEPDCSCYGKCGGCAFRHITREAELKYKLQNVNDAYERLGGLSLRCTEVLSATGREGYRNKAVFAVGEGPVFGFYREHSHDIIPMDQCLLQNASANRAAQVIREFMRENKIPAYNEETGKGTVRRIFVRTAADGRAQVCIVAAGGFGTLTEKLCDRIMEAVPECVSIVLNVNKSRGNAVLGGRTFTLRGEDTLSDVLCGLKFDLSPQSFYQVNHDGAELLYGKALEFASPDGKGTILDLYCGAGTISLCLARGCEKVIGAEIVPEAVENAKSNAERNGIANAEFICGDAADAARELQERGCRPDAVVVDPPRKGLERSVIENVCSMEPERVVYVSCNVATQARDLKIFEGLGYTAVKAVAVDMFPGTGHTESVVLLSRA